MRRLREMRERRFEYDERMIRGLARTVAETGPKGAANPAAEVEGCDGDD
jgi:hypothetical protein